jgi:predicted GNAT family acetyltransferase
MGKLTYMEVVKPGDAGHFLERVKTLLEEDEVSGSFAEKWTAITRCESSISVRMRAFKLTGVNPYNKPEGIFRNAEEKELNLIAQFIGEFSRAVKEPTGTERARQTAENGIKNRDIYVWENNGIVAMAKKLRPTKHGMAVCSVYTPEEHRNKGYTTSYVFEYKERSPREER